MTIYALRVAGATLFAACLCGATETRSWLQADYSDFQKGVRRNLSIRSDGRLTLAPKTNEVYDSSSSYLWTLAQDSHGALYTAGGPGARLYRIPPGGKGAKLAEFDALEVHAIAIDSNDHIYVATAPDGKIYRVESSGKSALFYDPKQKYIWTMICDPAGNLYIATGDQGEIHKVTPDGKGSVLFRSDETHIRSIAFDREGNIIAGTEPGGLIIRVSPAGEGFVMYQMPKREVTALAVGAANEIYAAAVGSKNMPRPATPAAAPAPAAPTPPAAPNPMTATPVITPVTPSAAPPASSQPVTVPGGSDVYVISERSAPRRLWTASQDVVYGLAFDTTGHLLIGSGNKGTLYRIDGPSLYTTLVTFPVEQVTTIVPAKDGSLYAATGNVGKVFRVGPGMEQEGSIESDVFDSGGFATWGRIQSGGQLNGGSIRLTARSGNLDRPQQNWSGWSQPVPGPEGGRVTAPPARFLQWKATLEAGTGDASPVLDSVDTAYLRQNVAPRIERIEITPYNYRFPAPTQQLTLSSAATLTLPAIGAKTPAPRVSAEPTTYPAMNYQKGALGIRWTSSDENGDSLIYSIEIRGATEKTWKPLRSYIHEKYFSFDSTAFPDGEYRVRIAASDSPSNAAEDALTSSEESDPFTIDNTPPVISNLQIDGNVVRWHAADALSTVYKAEYSVDGGDWTVVDPIGKLSDTQALDYSLTLSNLAAGEHTVAVRVSDSNENVAVEKLVQPGR